MISVKNIWFVPEAHVIQKFQCMIVSNYVPRIGFLL